MRVAAEQTHLGDDEERGDQTVDTLCTRKSLEQKCLTEFGRILAEHTAGGFSYERNALCTADTCESGGKHGTGDRQILTGDKLIQELRAG